MNGIALLQTFSVIPLTHKYTTLSDETKRDSVCSGAIPLVFRGVSKLVVMACPENTEDLRPLAVGQERHLNPASIYAQLH
jgi:hypothetical protein